MHEAMPIAGKIIKGGFAIAPKLALLSPAALEGLGVEGDDTRRKVIAAIATNKRNAGSSASVSCGKGQIVGAEQLRPS